MSMRELKIGLMLFLLFTAGAMSGVMLDRKFAPPREQPTRSPRTQMPFITGDDAPILAEMTRQMNLTSEQQNRVSELLKSWSSDVKRTHKAALIERQKLFDKTMPMIRTNLTDGQLAAFDRMLERSRRRQQQLLRNSR